MEDDGCNDGGEGRVGRSISPVGEDVDQPLPTVPPEPAEQGNLPVDGCVEMGVQDDGEEVNA